MTPSDLLGVPYKGDSGRSVNLLPAWWPTKENGVIFLDEINLGSPAMQAAAYQLVLDRKVGTHKLPSGFFIIAAGNRSSDKAAVRDLAAPLANRFVHVAIDVDYDEWRSWALGTSSLSSEEAVQKGMALEEARSLIVAFLDQESGKHLAGTPVSGPFPSPRSWEYVSRIMTMDLPIDVMKELIVGSIGGIGAEFLEFCNVRLSLPDIKGIISGKVKAQKVERADLSYYLLSVLETHFCESKDGKQKNNIFDWVAKSLNPEFVVMFLKRETVKSAGVKSLPSYGEFLKGHSSLILGKE